MSNTLPIPYISQITSGALSHANDCGPTSALMLAHAYKLAMTLDVDQVFDTIEPVGDTGVFAWQLQNWLSGLGIQNTWNLQTLNGLFSNLVARKPMIALIHYGTLVKKGLTELTGFTGAHFVVVTGMDIENVFINDPYRSTVVKGQNIPIPIATFMQCWYDAVLDGNISYCVLTPTLTLQDLSGQIPTPTVTDYTIIPNAIYIHVAPSETSVKLRVAYKGEILHTVGGVIGTTNYIQLVNNTGYAWYTFLQKVTS
jgi:hypothetical protein